MNFRFKETNRIKREAEKKKKRKKRKKKYEEERNFDKVGSNGLGAFGSCPIPDVNFHFFFFFFNRPKGRQ